MQREQVIGQLKRNWIRLEVLKREKTNELWIIEAQIEKIKSKLKSYGMDENLGLDQELVAVWEGISTGGGGGCDRSDVVRNDGM